VRSLYLSLAAGVACLALLAVPPAARAQMRALPMGPRFTFNGATHTVPFSSRGFVPPRISATTVQSNWNYWANGGYPNIVAARGYNLARHDIASTNRYALYSSLYKSYGGYGYGYYNPYAFYGYGYYNPYGTYGYGYSNPYAAYAANPYTMYGNYGDAGAYPSQPTADAYPSTGLKQSGRMIDVGLYDNRFEPRSITITAGATVRWTNYDTRPRSVVSDTDLWESGPLAPGSSHSYTFSHPGTYTYRSDNPRVRGTIIVE
jgi:plastocyanin